MDQLWRLAVAWYATRLEENSRRPQPEEMRAIFAGLGLEGDFWDPEADRFGEERVRVELPRHLSARRTGDRR